MSARCIPGKEKSDHRLGTCRCRNNVTTVVAVGNRAGHQHEQRSRRELGEAQPTEIQFVAADVEHLLAECCESSERRG